MLSSEVLEVTFLDGETLAHAFIDYTELFAIGYLTFQKFKHFCT